MIKKIAVLFAALFLLVGVSNTTQLYGAGSNGKLDHKWKFTKGEVFKLDGNLHIDASADIPLKMLLPKPPAGAVSQPAKVPALEGSEKASGNFDLEFQWQVTVLSIDKDGNAELEMDLVAAMLKSSGQLGEQQISYQADLLDPAAATGDNGQPQAIISREDAKNVWLVAPSGKILAINGKKMSETIDQLYLDLTNAGIKINQKDIAELGDMFFYFMVSYPEKPVAVGETWVREVDLSSLLTSGSQHEEVLVKNFELILQQNWTVKSSNGSKITLAEESQSMPKLAMEFDGPDAKVSLSVAGQEKGEIIVEKLRGLVNSTRQNLTVNGKLVAEEKGENGENFNIPFDINIRSNFSLTK